MCAVACVCVHVCVRERERASVCVCERERVVCVQEFVCGGSTDDERLACLTAALTKV